jgi:hypothetical protein
MSPHDIKTIDWIFRRFPNQPVRCALMVRILCKVR